MWQTSFLYGDIEEESFMKSPVGMEEIDPGSSPEHCYQLKRGSMDREKQQDSSGRILWTQFGICIIIMYVDDMMIIGKMKQIQDFTSKNIKEILSENTAQPCRLPGL